MTAEQGYDLAQFQCPGFKIVMGAVEAKSVPVLPLTPMQMRGLPGFSSWRDRDLHQLLGYVPSLWAQWACMAYCRITGRDMTADEWRWLAHPSTGLKEVRDWLDAAEPQPQRRA